MSEEYRKIQEILYNYQSHFKKGGADNFTNKSSSQVLVKDKCYPPLVFKTVNFIHDHLYDSKLTISFLKEQCNISGNNLTGKFSYYIGKTPKKYINFHRIQVSKKLLSSNNLYSISICQIALSLGYKHSSTFSKAFKNFTDTTPSEWRSKRIE